MGSKPYEKKAEALLPAAPARGKRAEGGRQPAGWKEGSRQEPKSLAP